jgi:hypothetical protein
MPRFELIWAQHAGDQFNSLSPATRQVVMDAIAEIEQDPTGRGTYDKTTDRYTADFAGEAVTGLIVYVVAQAQLRIIILRVTAIT